MSLILHEYKDAGQPQRHCMIPFVLNNKNNTSMDFDKKKQDEALKQKMRWEKWQREHVEAKQRALEFREYWERRKKEDKDLWRDKDFANAVDKMSRAGLQGKTRKLRCSRRTENRAGRTVHADGNSRLACASEWKKLNGKGRIEAQQEFIKLTNKMLTRYGWNPPEGWV